MPGQEHQDPHKEDGLPLRWKHIPQVQQHIRDTPEQQTHTDEPGLPGTPCQQESQKHKAQGSGPLQDDRGFILLLSLRIQKDSCKHQAEGNEDVVHIKASCNRFKKNRIEVDSAEFEQYYDLIATDRLLALKIFTPELIEIFNELRREHPKSGFELKIEGSKVYFRFKCGHDLFEPPIFKSDLDEKTIKRYFKLIYYPFELSKEIVKRVSETEI